MGFGAILLNSVPMRFDPQANYVPGTDSALAPQQMSYRGGSGFSGLMARFLVLLVIVGLGGAGWWFWTENVALAKPAYDVGFAPAGPQIVVWRPDDRVLHAYRAGLSVEAEGRPREAVPYFRRAVVLDPDFAEAHYHLGLAYARAGDDAAARAEHRTLQELNPDLAVLLAEHLP